MIEIKDVMKSFENKNVLNHLNAMKEVFYLMEKMFMKILMLKKIFYSLVMIPTIFTLLLLMK